MPRKSLSSAIGPQKVDGVWKQEVGGPSPVELLEEDKLDCDMCGSPMTLDKMIKTKGAFGRKWRVRKFSCECGYRTTIYGDGSRDTMGE